MGFKISLYWRQFTALLARVLLFCHALVSVIFFYNNNLNSETWLLLIPLGLLFVETLFMLVFRKGLEYRYFWLAGLFYMATIVPIIWSIELDLLQNRLNRINDIGIEERPSPNGTQPQGVMFFRDIKVSNEIVGKKICEIGIMIGVILGRWLMPRGKLTREQLSGLLLMYIGNAADIMELFGTFEVESGKPHPHIQYSVLSVYTWSLIQFTIVTTAAVVGDKESDVEKGFQESKGKIDDRVVEDQGSNSTHIISIDGGVEPSDAFRIPPPAFIQNCCKLHSETLEILATLFFQDVPFFLLRLSLCIRFNITNELHIFFMCKNGIVIILLAYRLAILHCSNNEKPSEENLAGTLVPEKSKKKLSESDSARQNISTENSSKKNEGLEMDEQTPSEVIGVDNLATEIDDDIPDKNDPTGNENIEGDKRLPSKVIGADNPVPVKDDIFLDEDDSKRNEELEGDKCTPSKATGGDNSAVKVDNNS